MVSKEKITNANSFPKDWPIKKLADIGSTYGGLINKSKEDFTEGNSKFITYKNIYNNTFINTNELESVRIDKDEKQNKVKYGDVFFTGSSETPDEVGISSVLLEEVDDVYLNSFCFGFRFNDLKKTIPEFYGYYFRGPVFRNEVYPLAQGSTRFNLSKSEMVKLKVPVPPIKEQHKIAAILSSVDKAIEKTEVIIEQTEKVKKGLMQQLLTKGIGHTKFKKTEIGEIPEEWEVKTFKEISVVRQGLQIPIAERFREPGKDRYVYITIQYLNNPDAGAEYIESPRSSVICNEDDVLMTRTGNTGQVVTNVHGVFHNNFFLIDYNREVIYKDYLVQFLNHEKTQQLIRKLAGTTTIPDLKHGDFYSIHVPIPPIQEQRKIATILKSVEDKVQKEKEKLAKLFSIKKALMQVLLTGKVRVKVDDEVMSQ